MNSIAGLEIRSGPHFFGDGRLTLTGNCCERHIDLHPFLLLVILKAVALGRPPNNWWIDAQKHAPSVEFVCW
jgi:hypothetical protein